MPSFFMEKIMNEQNLKVLTNIIGAVESGGQVYGKRRYNAYDPPYKNSAKEYTITIGWAQCYGHEARQLIREIYEADKSTFWKYDDCGIAEMIPKDWVAIRWNPTSKQKAAIISLIDSPVGHEVQDRLFAGKMVKLIDDCAKEYTTDVKAQMMYCEIRHLGGKGPCDRIFKRCNGKYDLDTIMASLVTDQRDTSSDNQVGDKIYWSRHLKCKEFIERYSVNENVDDVIEKVDETKEEPMAITEKDITLCGHGADNPRLIRMDTYLTQRYKKTAGSGSNTWHKGVVAVVRPIGMSDQLRYDYVKTYSTIIGRNIYSQTLREYCYTPYKGKYYSDCSSSQCLTLRKISLDIPTLNTVGMYNSDKFEKVPVIIKAGHIQNPEILEIGDQLLFAGDDPNRVLHIGHVEGVFAIKGREPQPYDETGVRAFQSWINLYYPNLVEQATGNPLVVDGDFGPKTKAAAVTVWKYMANKYYRASLTIGNINFFESCRAVAGKITFEEVKKHGTLAAILQGLLAKQGLYTGPISAIADSSLSDAVASYNARAGIGSSTLVADTWFKLFNN